MKNDFDFDGHFRSTRRLAVAGIVATALFYIAFLVGLGWLVVYAIDAFSA